GGVAGYSDGVIQNVYTKVEITGNNNLGGILGVNNGEIENFYATGNVNGEGSNIGGVIGYNNGVVNEGYAGGKVQGYQNVGGLIGFAQSLDITNVYYNRTIIEFDDLIQGRTKPLHAVSNQPGLNTLAKEKEEITGLNIFENTSLSNTVWTIKGSTGF